MENSSSSRGKGGCYWAFLRAQMDNFGCLSSGMGQEDPFNLTDLMDFDNYNDLTADQILPSFCNYGPVAPSNFISQNTDSLNGNAVGSSSSCVVKLISRNNSFQFGLPSDAPNKDDSSMNGVTNSLSPPCEVDKAKLSISRSPGWSLSERMLRALSLFKETSSAGILAQVWVPIKQGNEFVLSTYEQPYLLDQVLAGYREVSRAFTFSAKEKSSSFPGLPGRVFISKMPEWTSNVIYYSKAEYLRANYALNYEVRGSLAVPVFDPCDQSCCAVLELVTTKEKPNFDQEMDIVCRAIQAVDLRTVDARVHPQLKSSSNTQKAAFVEIMDVLRAVCHAHRLPLALTWIPCEYPDMVCNGFIRKSGIEHGALPWKKMLLCIQESACYVNDENMHGFVHACIEHHLEKGQGISGKALESNHPFFCSDVKGYDILEYPLAHHARKFGLNAAVAIRLRSTYTGDDDYILEFFLPLSCKGSAEQQLLLNNLSSTMQRICRSLRTVSHTELSEAEESKISIQQVEMNLDLTDVFEKNLQQILSTKELNPSAKVASQIKRPGNDVGEINMQPEQASSGPKRQLDKKRSTAEKNISLSVLQQYFSGSLKDAAKSIGVCPTTLKRICRQHGISRWPSRKINKVNRSLRKIQTVMESVQGVEGALKYDPMTGSLVATTSISPSHEASNNISSCQKNSTERNQECLTAPDIIPVKFEGEDYSISGYDRESVARPGSSNDKVGGLSAQFCNTSKFGSVDDRVSSRLNHEGKQWIHCKDAEQLLLMEGSSRWGSSILESSEHHVMTGSSSSMVPADMDVGLDADDGVVEHHRATSSGMTDSSNGSGSMMNKSASSSPSFTRHEQSNRELCTRDDGCLVSIKATYNEDTVRFKFRVNLGCLQLFEEIGKRFRLPSGSFQLKYLDDEDEWVMLVSDSDLQECVEVLESAGSHSVKISVRDLPCAVGSSASSNCLLAAS
ncbi:protein NLP9-like [Aristolochia californica]|uniref:protein NLP9-like n=1 Tax=Aristolochia californica TaxID=171875 RepID=UPI0035E16479